jgi:hypothetical protein
MSVAMFACSRPAPVAPRAEVPAAATPAPSTAVHPNQPRSSADAFAALGTKSDERSWISPGPVLLELGGSPIQPAHEGEPVEVVIIDDQGSAVHVGVHLEHVWFTAWIDRARLFAIVAHDTHVSARDGTDYMPLNSGVEPIQAVLHAGARVRTLAHKDHWSRVRYYGQVEVEGWVPDASLAEHAPARTMHGAFVHAHLTVLPGSVIRAEPRWAARALATTAQGYFVDVVKDVDQDWKEVVYADSDVSVHGYLSPHEPPGMIHPPRDGENIATISPNAKLPTGTCLYAREGGEPIGYAVQDTPTEIAAGMHTGWFDVAVDTPWGAVTFAAQGPTESELSACAPAATPPATSP